ncbi:hypothetical protein YPPY64_2442, partial [Yersinia pestis PY-64]
MRLPY